MGRLYSSASTSTGYFRVCPCNEVNSSTGTAFNYLLQYYLHTSNNLYSPSALKQFSMLPICSAQSDIYPYICKHISF